MTAGETSEALNRVPGLRDTAGSIPAVRRSAPGARSDERVMRYAPLLRFSSEESHFPIDPAAFLARAQLRRYGWSEDIRDAVWHPRRRTWEGCAAGMPTPAGAGHPDIAEVCRIMQTEARSPIPDGRNRRPCDARNLWYGRRAGYALELVHPGAPELRGERGHAPFLLYDRYALPTHAGVFDVITYWFFYASSTTAGGHEGDWQSVSVVIADSGSELPYVQFGSSRHGVTCGFAEVEVAEYTHPVVYVERGSHRMFRAESDLDGYSPGNHAVALRTWPLEARRVPTLPWSSFDGAWGRVGPGPRTTGALGPLFQREDAGSVGADRPF